MPSPKKDAPSNHAAVADAERRASAARRRLADRFYDDEVVGAEHFYIPEDTHGDAALIAVATTKHGITYMRNVTTGEDWKEQKFPVPFTRYREFFDREEAEADILARR